MNIKEVEQITGLKRGSIRFYEEEKLIKPFRSENGYRSYTEQDVILLKKIKLLRILGIPIQDVKKIVIHEESLAYFLEQNIYKMEEEKKNLVLSVNVCEQMLDDNVHFDTLNTDLYFRLLAQDFDLDRMNNVMEGDYSRRDEQAWQRYFARYIDLGIYGIVLWQVLFRCLGIDYLEWIDSLFVTGPFSLLKSFILALIPIMVMMVVEPILLSSIGTTFGKCIMRVRVIHKDGRYLTFAESIKRTWFMLRLGMGFGIPFYELYRNYNSYGVLEEGKELPWEEATESSTDVFPMNRIYCLIFIVMVITIVAIKCL